MKLVDFLSEFIVVFTLVFITNTIVVYLWNTVKYGDAFFDWERTLILSIVVGIVVPLWNRLWRRQHQRQ